MSQYPPPHGPQYYAGQQPPYGMPQPKGPDPRKSRVLVPVALGTLVAVVAIVGIVAYVYVQLIDSHDDRSTIGGCINDVFRVSKETDAPLAWHKAEHLDLPKIDLQMSIKSELPEDLGEYSFIAAVCCAEGGQDIKTCSEAVRGFVDTHPDAAATISDDAPAIQEIEKVVPNLEASSEEGDAIAAILAEADKTEQERAAYALLTETEVEARRDALRRFYSSGNDRLRRVAIAYLLEQTREGKVDLVAEIMPSEGSAPRANTDRLERALAGASLSQVELDRATGGLTCRFAGIRCSGTLGDDYLTLTTRSGTLLDKSTIRLKPIEDGIALLGTLVSKEGETLGLKIRLM